MKIEVWSDIACPFCYIGKRHLEAALAAFPHRDAVEVTWKSFELNPNADVNEGGKRSMASVLAEKFGTTEAGIAQMQGRIIAMAKAAGLDFHLDRAVPTNTFDAHQLIHLAAHHGLGDAMKERLLTAYFLNAEHVGERDTLVRLGEEVGLDAEEVRRTLESSAYIEEVRADEAEARDLGINGVPFFVVDRKYALSGAQPLELFGQVLEKAWSEQRPLQMVSGTEDAACADGQCDLP